MALVGGSTGFAIGGWFLLDLRRLGPAGWVSARSRAGAWQGTTYPSGGGALTVPRGAAPRGPSVIGSWSRWDRRRLAPATWFPARSRAGIQAFSRESPDAKSRGGMPPAPPLFLGPARSHSLVLAWWGAAGRSLGYFRAQVRALIWIRILRGGGWGKKNFVAGV